MEAFTTFSTQQAERVPAWRAMVEAYENDPKQKNPYEMAVKGRSFIPDFVGNG
jgi:hypothetical protein